MNRRIFDLPTSGQSRERKLLLILLAALIALVLWNSIWLLLQLAVFAVIVYTVYILLKHYL
jgi:Flp pilus assembly protein TadB